MQTRVIAHRLEKKQGFPAEVYCRSELNPNDSEPVEKLVEGARRGVSRSGASGKFDRDAAGQSKEFEALLKKYFANPSEQEFISFTISATKALLGRLQRTAASGGNLVFIHYEAESGQSPGVEFLLIALISEQAATAFDDEMNVLEATVLDLDKLRHGVRVRVEHVENNSDGVLTLLSGKRAASVAEYFSNFIGSAEFTDSKESAQGLRKRIDEWFANEQLDKGESDKYLSNVYRFWKENEGSRNGVSVPALSRYLYPDGEETADRFLEFMVNETEGIPAQTVALKAKDMNPLFRKFVYRGDGLILEFDRTGNTNWASKITPDQSGQNVIIRNAPSQLIEALRNG